MNLECIFDVEKNEDQKREYQKIYTNLKDKYGRGKYKSFDKDALFENYEDKSTYARRTHTGKIREGIELTPLELSMVCDSGFSHFGGSSNIYSDRSFKVVIYTD